MSLQNGLVGHWTMDDSDTSGGTLYDRSAYDRNGDLRNGVSTSVSSLLGEGYSYDGTDDFVRMPQDSYEGALDETTAKMSLACWLYPTGLQTNSTNHSIQNCWMAHSSSSFNDNMEMGVDASTNDIQVYFDTNGADSTNTSTGVTAPLNAWTHAVVTLDLSGTPTMKLYKNGELGLTDTSTWSATNGTLDQAGAEFTLGASRSFREPYTGRLSDARIYNRVLSASEARALFNMRSQRQQNIIANIRYNDSQSLYDSNNHPTSKEELDNFFDISRSDVSNLFATNHDRQSINHGAEGQSTSEFGSVNSVPYYLDKLDGYSWKLEGDWTATETGTYTFAIDGDDAMDVLIDGNPVTTFYGGHGFDGTVDNHSGTISLTKGKRYRMAFRYEEGGGGSGFVVGYKKPSDSNYVLFPADKVF